MKRHRPYVILPVLVLSLFGVACAPTASSPSASASGSRVASQSAEASQSAAAAASAEASAAPSEDLGAFACDFPVNGVATVDRAQITDVRVGTHDGYDRVVFQFDAGIPEFTLEEATPPLLQDPSGRELDVDGTAFLKLVMHGGTVVNPDGVKTYKGPLDFKRDFPKLAELISGGDFEAVSSWYIGLTDTSCVRVLTLNDPSRLVIDLEQ